MAAREPLDGMLQVDAELVSWLKQRVALWKTEGEGIRRLSPAEQQQRLERLRVQLGDCQLDAELVSDWLKHADSLCARASSQGTTIAYLGPVYSYSYLAAVKYFGAAAELVPVATIEAAFREVIGGHSTYAVVPIENSTDGRVVDTLGMFAKTPVQICGEVQLPIHHCLLGTGKRADVVEVHSKPQALSQCRRWLAEHLPSARVVEASSTAIAAAHAAQQPGVAAIASMEAGIHHGLEVLDANIEDNQHNVTRFAIIGNDQSAPSERDKTSLMFQLEHQPGALARAMTVFERAAVNLTWIESFPLPDHPNEYLFFVELEGHSASRPIHQAIETLSNLTRRLEVLGSYPRGQ